MKAISTQLAKTLCSVSLQGQSLGNAWVPGSDCGYSILRCLVSALRASWPTPHGLSPSQCPPPPESTLRVTVPSFIDQRQQGQANLAKEPDKERNGLHHKPNLGISFYLRVSFSQCPGSFFLFNFLLKAVKPIALVSITFICLYPTR